MNPERCKAFELSTNRPCVRVAQHLGPHMRADRANFALATHYPDEPINLSAEMQKAMDREIDATIINGPNHDPVNHPQHYTSHPSGVECITITQHMNFCRGNAVKYIWRAGEKADEVEDLRKARWYIDKEIERLEAAR